MNYLNDIDETLARHVLAHSSSVSGLITGLRRAMPDDTPAGGGHLLAALTLLRAGGNNPVASLAAHDLVRHWIRVGAPLPPPVLAAGLPGHNTACFVTLPVAVLSLASPPTQPRLVEAFDVHAPRWRARQADLLGRALPVFSGDAHIRSLLSGTPPRAAGATPPSRTSAPDRGALHGMSL